MTILEALKVETRPEHDSIEKTLDLMNPQLGRERYQEILKGFYGFYFTIEGKLRHFPEIYPPEREKIPLLVNDLKYFGTDVKSLTILDPEDVPFWSPEDVLGVVYVIEGSTLGGQFLSKQFSKKFGLSAGSGLDFFTGYGTLTMPRWMAMKDIIQSRSTPNDFPHIIASAKVTFKSLEAWISTSHPI